MRTKENLIQLTGRQHGVISRAQALQAGMTRRSIDGRLVFGQWQRMLPGVYRMSTAPDSWMQRLMAAWLWAGEGAVVSHTSAAVLLELEGIKPGKIEITTLRRLRAPAPWITVHFTCKLPACDLAARSGVKVTEVSRTLFDLGAVLDEEAVEIALEDALRRGLTSLPRLRWRLEQLGAQGRGGGRILRRLLDARAPGTRPTGSLFEVRLLRVLVAAGLPKPLLQYEVRVGRKIIRIDFAYPEMRVAIEAQSFRFHSRRADWEADIARRNALADQGWRIIEVTWEDVVRRPEIVVDRIASALGLARRRTGDERSG